MEEPRQPESISTCRNVSDVAYYVRKKIELCIQNYKSLEVTATYLEKNHQISKSVTHLVWEQLRQENPVFFNHFEMRCKLNLQMRMFNDMLTKQAVRMFENELIVIFDASPSVRTLGETTTLPQTQILYDQQDQVLNPPASFAVPPNLNQQDQVLNPPASFAMPPNLNQQDQLLNPPASFAIPPNLSGPNFDAQWQIPNEQLNHQHFDASGLSSFANANGSSMTPPIPYDQQEQPLSTTCLQLPAANGPSMTQLPPIPNNQQEQQHLHNTSLPLPAANGASMTQLPPIPNNQQEQPHQDPCSTNNNDLISPTVAPADTDDWFQLIGPSEDLAVLSPLPPEDTNPLSLSDYISWSDPMPEDLSIFELGGDIMSAGMDDLNEQQQHLNGQYQPHLLENGDKLLCNNFDITPPMQTDTSLHQQQAGGITHNHPESEALNNPDSAAQLVTQHQNGHYQPQQNVSVETLQRGERSNVLVNGESNDRQRNLEKSHSKRMCTSVDQSGRVKLKRHHPEEPEALNNPNSGNGTQTTGVNHQRSPKARATTRSLKSWELRHVVWAKARVTCFLEWGRLREAGFTEQRSPPALDGGRITGHCLPSPL
ncbi:hypothetical protein N665_4215s0004 [Sinapis alba]|nr:hypothetical protein N665_4215s0004 [Sinapis alba]